MFVRGSQSLATDGTNSPVKFPFIDHNLCVEIGACLFQALFCVCASVLKETRDL